MTPNSHTSAAVSRGECHVTAKQCFRFNEVKKIVFNNIALNVPKEVAVQEMVNKGLIINVHCKELVRFVRYYNGKRAIVTKGVYRTLCNTATISVTREEAETLTDMLTLRQLFLTIDLKDTELFTSPDLWEKLGVKDKPHGRKLFLVLTDAHSTHYETTVRSQAKRKKALKISSVVFNVFLLLPIGMPLLITGRKTSTCSKFHHTWHDIFNNTMDISHWIA